MKVVEVARRLHVSGGTVRNWSAEFGEFLSPSASPGAGMVRSFNEDDLRVLASVAAWKSQGATYAQTAEMLRRGELADVPIPEAPPQPADEPRALVVSAFQQFEKMLERLNEENQALREENAILTRQNVKLESQLLYHQKSLWQRIRGK